MRKHVIDRLPQDAPGDESRWLDLVHIACVEVTSEDESHPIESALLAETGAGWRASHPGEQIIRLVFDKPQQIKLIKLLFVEDERARTQEYVLRWSRNEGTTYQEILRQQYNFSPPDTIRESEVHALNLDGITALELSIVPDISGEDAYASLACLRLA
ncbi:MAG: hypothetical protein ABI977_34610 [Acidobacteriota bacterium]